MKLYQLNRRLLLLGEHCYLDTGDECYFTDEYECRHRQGIKSQVLSLKRGDKATITYLGEQLASAIPPEWVPDATCELAVMLPGDKSRSSFLLRGAHRRKPQMLLVQSRGVPCNKSGNNLASGTTSACQVRI